MLLFPSKQSLSCLTNRKNKDEVAVREFIINFMSRLHDCMKKCGFDISEREVYHPTFQHFLHLTLHDSFRRLFRLKLSSFQRISEEERGYGERLNVQKNLVIDVEPRMGNALKLMIEELPVYIEHCMRTAGFDPFEMQESHKSYTSLFSKLIVSETMKFFNLKSKFKCVGDDQVAHSETVGLTLEHECPGDDQVSSAIFIDLSSIDQCSEDEKKSPKNSTLEIIDLASKDSKDECSGDDENKSVEIIDLAMPDSSSLDDKSSSLDIIDLTSPSKHSSDEKIEIARNVDQTSSKLTALCEPKNSGHKNTRHNSTEDEYEPSKELIIETKKHRIYRVTSKNIAIKVLKSSSPPEKDIKNLDNELKVAKVITHPAIRPSIERKKIQSKEGLVLAWANGYPISDVKGFTVMEFLTVAREIVSSLLAMHMKHMIHMNISCEHIIFSPEDKSITLIGCGSSSSFDSEKICISNQELQERDLCCISPEQTARANVDIDYRSDFYSLGVVLYRLLTKKYPFESDNALKLLHLHLFQDALPICMINPSIPMVVSNMIAKLMAKKAEDRYQSAKGIIYDIDMMVSEYETDKNLSSISLAQHDIPEAFMLPQNLYGRSNHCDFLTSVLERVLRRNSFELVLVIGDAGIGKTTLVAQLYKHVIKQDGLFIRGKSDFSKQKPYSALLEAMEHFCDDLQLKDKTTIAMYKYRIQHALGDEGRVLTEVITNLHYIIGEQPHPLFDSFGQEAKNRFSYVFMKFIQSICLVGFPIVLVLEDLQWMDSESFCLLSTLVANKCIKNLMLIGTYRENETSENHEVINLEQNVRKMENIKFSKIKLDNLDCETLNEFISNALCLPSHESYGLTVFIHKKTKGNPFFVHQMLKSLSEQRLVFFCDSASKWKWDASIFGENDNISENIIEVLRNKVLCYPLFVQQALKVASCLGSHFSLSSVKLVINSNQGIEGALNTGMIKQNKGSEVTYRFVHDHMREACLSLIPNKKEIVWYIGKKLWNLFSSEELEENIFVVASLLHQSINNVSDEDESFKISSLFMQAGKKALLSMAFKQAFNFLDSGIQLLNNDSWRNHYELSLQLHDLTAKAAYCIQNYKRMDECINEIFENVSFTLHLIQSYSLLIKKCNDKRSWDEAISISIHILDRLGEKIRLDDIEATSASEFIYAKSLIKSEKQILELQAMENSIESIMLILGSICTSCFCTNRELLAYVASRMVQLTIKHGISKYSSIGFCVFGSFLSSEGDSDGYEFGKWSLTLLKKSKAKELYPLVYLTFFGFIKPFYTSIHYSLQPLEKCRQISMEVGSDETSNMSAYTYSMYSFLAGSHLENLLVDVEKLRTVISVQALNFLSTYQAIRNLQDENTKNPSVLNGDAFCYKSCYDQNEKAADIVKSTICCFIVACIFNDYSFASEFAEVCRSNKKYIMGTFLYPIFLFYDGLISLMLVKENKKEELIQNAKESISKLRFMSENAPENYLNKAFLLEAELALVLNDDKLQAANHYRKAISLSKEYGFVHEEAIAYENAGTFYLKLNVLTTAHDYLIKSYRCYEMWGANAKMSSLIKKYPFISEKLNNSSLSLHELELPDQCQGSVISDISAVSAIKPMSKKKRART